MGDMKALLLPHANTNTPPTPPSTQRTRSPVLYPSWVQRDLPSIAHWEQPQHRTVPWLGPGLIPPPQHQPTSAPALLPPTAPHHHDRSH